MTRTLQVGFPPLCIKLDVFSSGIKGAGDAPQMGANRSNSGTLQLV